MALNPLFDLAYVPLLTLKVLHGHYLDAGTDVFASLSPARQSARLENYALQEDLQAQPAPGMEQYFRDHHLLLRTTSTGCILWIQVDANGVPKIQLDPNQPLRLLLRVSQPNWFRFTDLPLEGLHTSAGQSTYYHFSNRESVTFPALGTAGNFAVAADRIDQKNRPAEALPSDTFALIECYPSANGVTDFDLLNAQGQPQHTTETGFELRLAPRKTWWRYHSAQGTAVSTQALPITRGQIKPVPTLQWGTKPLPNAQPGPLIPDDQQPTKLYSDIYL